MNVQKRAVEVVVAAVAALDLLPTPAFLNLAPPLLLLILQSSLSPLPVLACSSSSVFHRHHPRRHFPVSSSLSP